MQLHKQTTKVRDILIRVAERDFVFVLIMVSGHWVLWTNLSHKVSKLTTAIVFCDPLNNKATSTLRSLANIVIQTISSAPEYHTIVFRNFGLVNF